MSDALSLILAGYQTVDAAERDFDGLVGLVQNRHVRTEGLILVQRDEGGAATAPAGGRFT